MAYSMVMGLQGVKEFMMLEMAAVLLVTGILMMIAYEFSYTILKREWGENYKSIF